MAMERISQEDFEKKYGSEITSQFTSPNKRPSVFKRILSDIPQDISQAVSEVPEAIERGKETALEAREQVTTGEISPIAGTAKTIGGGLRAGAEAVGSFVSGLLKLPFTQKAEQATAEAVQTGAERVAETEVVQEAVDRYQSLSPEQKAIVDGVIGTAEGLAVAAGAGPAVQITKKAITSPIPAIKVGFEKMSKATQVVEDLGSGAVGKARALELGLKPENLMQRVARVSKKKQSDFKELSKTKANPEGESIGEYLVARNVFGTPDEIVDQLYKRMQDSRSRLDASLSTVKGEFKAPQVQTALQQLIERDTKISTPGALHPDSKRIEQLFVKYNQQGLNLSEVNEVKRLYERNIKLDFLRDNVAEGIEKSNAIDSALRNLVEDKASKAGVETVRQLNKETQLAKRLVDDIGQEYAGAAGNNAIGLTDAIFLAEAVGSTNPIAATGFVVKKGLGSKTVMSEIAKRTSRQAGTKEALPDVPEQDKLTGYLKFLEETSQIDQ